MIRYVLAVLLTTALLGIGLIAVQEVAVVRTETQVEGAITDIERAAVSLLAYDDPVSGDIPPPRRVLDIEIPPGGFTTEDIETLRFEPVTESNWTAVRYKIDGRPTNTVFLDVPLVNAADDTATLDISGSSSLTLVLELVSDSGHKPVVQVRIGLQDEP
ncbi:hypothetical protein ACFQJ7_07690 [Halovenus rubra]|uniref:Uncharacterized protein n=2 Tax=Halovenus rubra TaxID=869890 RepID=A0ACC7E2G6_9EURY|nr:hypothetical protein [Halovenus rubra]